jgi:hypothetical protein
VLYIFEPFVRQKAKILINRIHIGNLYPKNPFYIVLTIKIFSRIVCLVPGLLFKLIIIDGELAYTGSANLTGAGLGMKSTGTRNFESGIITTNPELIDEIMTLFDEVWMGKFCKTCKRKKYCNGPI